MNLGEDHGQEVLDAQEALVDPGVLEDQEVMEGQEDTTDHTIDQMKIGALLQRIHIQLSQILTSLVTDILAMAPTGGQAFLGVEENMTPALACRRRSLVLEWEPSL